MERKLSPSTIPRSSLVEGYKGRVCLICFSDCYNYNILILDFSAAAPTIFKKSLTPRFKDYGQTTFCVSDPYLYVIFSNDAEFFSKPTLLSMCKCYYSSSIGFSKSDLLKNQVREMNGPKRDPRVAPSPDGRKILVYSTIIEYLISKLLEFEDNATDFEVFDTETEEWSILPQLNLCIPHGIDPRSFYQQDKKSGGGWIEREGGRLFNKSGLGRSWYFRVSAGNFINGNTFLVTLEVGLMFALNLDSHEEGWKPYGDKHIEGRWDEFLVFESLVLTPWLVRVIRGDEVVKQFKLSSEYPTSSPCLFTRLSVLKYVENQECFTCTMRGWVDEDTSVPFLICDIFKLDLGDGDGNGKESQPTHLVSYKCALDMACRFFCVEDVFPVAVKSYEEGKDDVYVGPTWLSKLSNVVEEKS